MSDTGIFRRDPSERRAVVAIAGTLCALGALSSQFPWTCGLIAAAGFTLVGLRCWLAHRAHVARIEAAMRADEARADAGVHQVLRAARSRRAQRDTDLEGEADPGSWAA